MLPCHNDVQNEKPFINIGLSRVGVTGLTKIIHRVRDNRENVLTAKIDVFVDLKPDQKGIHMSRSLETINEIIEKSATEDIQDVELFCLVVAKKLLEKHSYAEMSEVWLEALYPRVKQSPATKKKTQEIYKLKGIAAARRNNGDISCKKVVGVEVEGLTACPCGQELTASIIKKHLEEKRIEKKIIDIILKEIPSPTHNQRGSGVLLVGFPEKHLNKRVEADILIDIVESSMSSPLYEILKRPDEAKVIWDSHHHPRFVEDVVRAIYLNLNKQIPWLPDEAFILASQTNFESIHRHNAFAERYGLWKTLKAELQGKIERGAHLTLDGWLRL